MRSAALEGGLLAILIIFFFLRDAWSTFIIALSIPVSIIATFFFMGQFGLTLNVMSLGGLALATGMVVDNSIVVLENIAKMRERGMGVLEAAIKGTCEVGMAVTASTLTTVAVFFPLVFVEGIAGQLFRDQALTVTIAMLISLVVAMTLIPMLASLQARAPQSYPEEARAAAGAAAAGLPRPDRARVARLRAASPSASCRTGSCARWWWSAACSGARWARCCCGSVRWCCGPMSAPRRPTTACCRARSSVRRRSWSPRCCCSSPAWR